MLKTIKKLFGSKSERDVKEIAPLVKKIHQEYEVISKLSNNELRKKTAEFKEKIALYLEQEEKEIKDLRNRLGTEIDIENEEKSIPQKKRPDEIESEPDSLPDFDDDTGPFDSDSDLSDSLMDLTDAVEETDDNSQDILPDFQEENSGDELPDIDEIELDEDMMESDLSGDEDLSDMEFEDLEPDDKK